MKYIVDHDLHVHSYISPCSSEPEQTPMRILKYAEDNNYNTVCITDHFWDPLIESEYKYVRHLTYSDLEKIKPLPQTENVRFLFGCEADMDCKKSIGLSKTYADKFDFIVVATTHFHMKNAVLTEWELMNSKTRAKAWIERIDRLLENDLPFYKMGLAHLSTGQLAPTRQEMIQVLDYIPSSEMYRVFEKVASVGMGIELNARCMNYSSDEEKTVLRPYLIAKECGCKFYCGSDAHRPSKFVQVKEILQKAVDQLGLKESEKFVVK